MTKSHNIGLCARFRVAALLSLAVASAASAQDNTVLMLLPRAISTGHAALVEDMQARLSLATPPVELLDEAIDLSTAPGGRDEIELVNSLLQKYADERIDLIVAFGRDAAAFRMRQREVLFPEVPLVFAVVSGGDSYEQFRPPNSAGVVGDNPEDFQAAGIRIAELTLRILGGESADQVPLQYIEPTLISDGPEVRRQNLEELSPQQRTASVLRAQSLWAEYHAWISVIGGLLLLQTAAIAALLLLRTRQRRVEQTLRTTERRYRNVVESQSDLICRYLPDTTLTFVNGAYCRYFARTSEELLGTRFVDLVPASDRQGVLDHVASLVANPRKEANTHQVLNPDGSIGWQQWVDHVIVDSDGDVVEIQGIGRDITELRRAEIEAEQRREQVMHLTRVATLGELSGAFAHELNQPLTGILSNAQTAETLIDRDPLDRDELHAILSDIVADNRRAGEVISRLRALVRKDDASFESIDLGALVSETLSLVRTQLLEHQVEVQYQRPSSLAPVFGDRVQLQQVLLNLILNACEAMDGESTPRVLEISIAADCDSVEITLTDTGPGLPPEVEVRLFEPFVTTRENGLGLGLSICESIITAHHGSLHGGNNGDRGATFRFALPTEKSDTPKTDRPRGMRA